MLLLEFLVPLFAASLVANAVLVATACQLRRETVHLGERFAESLAQMRADRDAWRMNAQKTRRWIRLILVLHRQKEEHA